MGDHRICSKAKGISVAELCGKEVSRSVYERFVKIKQTRQLANFHIFTKTQSWL